MWFLELLGLFSHPNCTAASIFLFTLPPVCNDAVAMCSNKRPSAFFLKIDFEQINLGHRVTDSRLRMVNGGGLIN